MSCDQPRSDSLCFGKNVRRTDRPRLLLFSEVKCVLVNLIASLYVMPTPSGFMVFFRGKRASQESCQIGRVHFPPVFSGKMLLRSEMIEN